MHQDGRGIPPALSESRILSRALPRAGRTIRMLLKLILPISFGVSFLRWTGALTTIGTFFAPAMEIFRLPGEAAVPLISAFLGGIYALVGAMAVLPLRPVDVTVLSAMALVAHNLIVESTVQDRAGTPWWWTLSVRLAGALILGVVVSWSIAGLASLHIPALWLRFAANTARSAVPVSGGLGAFLRGWALEASRLTVKLVVLVTAMMVATEWIRSRGIMRRLEHGCRPVLRFLGLPDRVAYPWLTAQLLGVAFGAGLLIEEIRENAAYRPRDVRALHTSIGISHSILEDTILLAAVGASIFWIIVPRILLAAALVRVVQPLPMALRPLGIGRNTLRKVDP